MKTGDLKVVVQEKYGAIAKQSLLAGEAKLSCCGTSGCCEEIGFSMIGDEYNTLEGYNPDADLGLRCGLPTQFADLKTGDHVLDLGSGAGNDCFVARSIVGETGKVIGLDLTNEMVAKAKNNNRKLGYTNVEFVQGDIEKMPFSDNHFDVVVSNCVLNLVSNKHVAFAEIMRVLKPGGHFCVSDVVTRGELPEILRADAEMYVGCVSGAITREKYIDIINNNGFENITIHKLSHISIPDNILAEYMSEAEIIDFKNGETGIFSITVSGYKL